MLRDSTVFLWQVAHEFVFAAVTSADRAAWANALMDAISRVQSGAPTAGWLHKEGGRKSGLSLRGWQKRWFTLAPAADGGGELHYFEVRRLYIPLPLSSGPKPSAPPTPPPPPPGS